MRLFICLGMRIIVTWEIHYVVRSLAFMETRCLQQMHYDLKVGNHVTGS